MEEKGSKLANMKSPKLSKFDDVENEDLHGYLRVAEQVRFYFDKMCLKSLGDRDPDTESDKILEQEKQNLREGKACFQWEPCIGFEQVEWGIGAWCS